MAYTATKEWTTENTSLEVWQERDRLHISLEAGDATIGEWWDDDARQMLEDGFFDHKAFVMGKLVDKDRLHRSVVTYANVSGYGCQLRLRQDLEMEPDAHDMEVADRLWPELEDPMD